MSAFAKNFFKCTTLYKNGGGYMETERALLAKVVGEYLVSLRKDKNIRQEELARLSGIEQRSLRRIELGVVSVTFFSLRRLLKTLDEDWTEFWDKVDKNMELRMKDR